MFNRSVAIAICLTLFVWVLLLQLFNIAKNTSAGAKGTTTESYDETRSVYCPAGRYLGTGGSNVVVDFKTNAKDDSESEVNEYSNCYLAPIRLYNPRPHCMETKKRYCTPENVINVCYNTAPCAPGFQRVSAVVNRYSDRTGGRIESQAVCCRQ